MSTKVYKMMRHIGRVLEVALILSSIFNAARNERDSVMATSPGS